MHPPTFWYDKSARWQPVILSPIAGLYRIISRITVDRTLWKASVPVICCGNISVGGTGKTTVALALGQFYKAKGVNFHYLIRGYKGQLKGPVRVEKQKHTAKMVGDEALLLASMAPCWVGSKRDLSARAAIKAGAELLIMDDGMQNSTLVKDLCLVVVDGAVGFGNGWLLPSGPLREPIAEGLSRANAVIIIGRDRMNVRSLLPEGLDVWEAELNIDPYVGSIRNKPVIAFSGIGRPEKFFQSLINVGVNILTRHSFPDHHFYSASQLDTLLDHARRCGAVLVTTTKDAARLPLDYIDRVEVIGLEIQWTSKSKVESTLSLFSQLEKI